MTRYRRASLAVILLASGIRAVFPSGAQAAGGGSITKLAVYILENHSQAPSYAGMPYLSSLAAQYGKATNYRGVTHPSEGNYVTMISGQGKATCGIPDPKMGQCNQPGGTVFGQAIAAGKTAKLYQDGMSSNCSGSGDYGHNPWLHFPAEAAQCAQFDVPMGSTSGGNLASDITAGLPNLSMIVPNDVNNSHDGPLGPADTYMQGWLQAILAGPDWHSGHLAVVITFDEGTTTEDVAFAVVSPTVAAGTVYSGAADHNALERLYATVAGVAPINGGLTAPDLASAFNFAASTTPPPPTSTPSTTTAPTVPHTGTTTATTVPQTATTTATTAPKSTTSTTAAPPPTTTAPPPSTGTGAGTLHYTANEDGNYAGAGAVGYNVHDTGASQGTIDSLPAGGRAMVWLGEKCPSGLSSSLTSAVNSLGHDPRVLGYYLSDEPDPHACPQGPANAAAETDYIHAHGPGQKSFVVVDDTPGAWAAYAPTHSHLDLIGLDPYPCRVDTHTCDNTMIDSAVNQAQAAGIPKTLMVPTFQDFGGASAWFMPNTTQLKAILDRWDTLVPNPPMDYSYSWGCQGGSLSDCLANHPEAQQLMAAHNQTHNTPPPPPATTTTTPTTTPPTSTAPPSGTTTSTTPATTAPPSGATTSTTPTTMPAPPPTDTPTTMASPPPSGPPPTLQDPVPPDSTTTPTTTAPKPHKPRKPHKRRQPKRRQVVVPNPAWTQLARFAASQYSGEEEGGLRNHPSPAGS